MSNAKPKDREPRVTAATLARRKRAGERFACLTAYDASFARVLEEAGVEVILVGDSLGMVVQGEETTVPVTLDAMVYHTRAVARACRRALVMADLPFMTYT
ncbi:MAG: 3-methyl-2-oxobutanoate hydroxymethyltransferase, partial [Gammaproteobacteria bacterium]|nr:3-methyl-2-oxobutanoate hydroxymethyltransferase [Gammaproteobacteria bacterium]